MNIRIKVKIERAIFFQFCLYVVPVDDWQRIISSQTISIQFGGKAHSRNRDYEGHAGCDVSIVLGRRRCTAGPKLDRSDQEYAFLVSFKSRFMAHIVYES